jgi:hypothetical protein
VHRRPRHRFRDPPSESLEPVRSARADYDLRAAFGEHARGDDKSAEPLARAARFLSQVTIDGLRFRFVQHALVRLSDCRARVDIPNML